MIKQEEKIKFTRGASGKYGYEVSLLGKVEEQIARLIKIKHELDIVCIQANNDKGGEI